MYFISPTISSVLALLPNPVCFFVFVFLKREKQLVCVQLGASYMNMIGKMFVACRPQADEYDPESKV